LNLQGSNSLLKFALNNKTLIWETPQYNA
jgi:hypothetical protein